MKKNLWIFGWAFLLVVIAALAVSPRSEYQEIIMFEVMNFPGGAGRQEFSAAFGSELARLGYENTGGRSPRNCGGGNATNIVWYAHRSGDREFQWREIGDDLMLIFTTRAEGRLWGLVNGRRRARRDADAVRAAFPQLKIVEGDIVWREPGIIVSP
ncbi:MAG: hypothetical protein HPZ91_15895 [Lentisphaeria bacterium]|nr:hypothetical protein [Lentisphaeria bacterium]